MEKGICLFLGNCGLQKGLLIGTVEQIADTGKRGKQIVVHAFVQPVQQYAHQGTFIKSDEKLLVFGKQRQLPCGSIDILGDGIEAEPIQFLQKNFTMDRMVDVKDGFLAADAELHKGGKAVQRGAKILVGLYDVVGISFYDLLQKGGNVMEMVIKGIPIDLADLYNVVHSDFIIWLFF